MCIRDSWVVADIGSGTNYHATPADASLEFRLERERVDQVLEDIVADHEVEVVVRQLVYLIGNVADQDPVEDSLRPLRRGFNELDAPDLACSPVLQLEAGVVLGAADLEYLGYALWNERQHFGAMDLVVVVGLDVQIRTLIH